MKKLNITFILIVTILLGLLFVQNVKAYSMIDNGLNFLRSKQDETGRINTGFSAPSQWSAIAFAANGIDILTVKNPSISLQDFLMSNVPSEPSAATDWETRILAIVATNGDPTNYGGINYVNHLEGFYNNNQLGDVCSLNDDIFGLLAEITAGSSSSSQIKQDVLNFIISKQDTFDGGFGYSAPGCDWYSTSADMTAAAIQALVAAKENGLSNPNLDNSIDLAKNYLLTNQDGDGGFGYYGSSDPDTTGWVLMAFNVLDIQDSTASAQTKNWLISQQSPDDGGFLAYDYGSSSFVTNATTTAQAIIGLSGKSWILKIFDPLSITPTPTSGSGNPTPTVTFTPTPTATPTPTISQTSSSNNNPTSTPTQYVTPIIDDLGRSRSTLTQIQPTRPIQPIKPSGQILGEKTQSKTKKNYSLPFVFLGLGILFALLHYFKTRK